MIGGRRRRREVLGAGIARSLLPMNEWAAEGEVRGVRVEHLWSADAGDGVCINTKYVDPIQSLARCVYTT